MSVYLDSVFQKDYNLLNEERKKISKLQREFQTLNSAEENSRLVVTSNYYRYIILLFTTILITILFIRYASTGKQNSQDNSFINNIFFIFSIVLIFLSFYKIANIYDVYIFISILVIIYIIVKINLNQ